LHLQSLLKSNSIVSRPNEELDALYQQQPVELLPSKEVEEVVEEPERMVLTMDIARLVGEKLGVPDLAVECERAVRQVEKRIEGERKQQATGKKEQ
jgi:hypothetical protein